MCAGISISSLKEGGTACPPKEKSESFKSNQVSVAVKKASKCALKCALPPSLCELWRTSRVLPTLNQTLQRTLRRPPYSDTLKRPTYPVPCAEMVVKSARNGENSVGKSG